MHWNCKMRGGKKGDEYEDDVDDGSKVADVRAP
jgi:hypothetical protein